MSERICKCDPDAPYPPEDYERARDGIPEWNTRAHIKQTLQGHWPLTAEEDTVECERCAGIIKKTASHKRALNREPLA